MSKPIQQQVARLVWHANYSFKRSLSAVTNAATNAMPTPNPNYSSGFSGAGAGGPPGSLNKNWIHPPDALIYGRVEYTVKLLGDVPVEQAKGTDVIKGAIQVLRFNLSLKKAAGFKLQKVELHINVDGVNIVDAKTKMVLHKYPLHRISFCADDKTDKRLFAFIARQQSSSSSSINNNNTDGGCCGGGTGDSAQKHHCYVFLSDKLSEEITLTIGEAFDLAYRRFLDNNGRDLESKKQSILLRKRVNDLEMENAELKRQLAQQQRSISNSSVHHPQNSLVDILSGPTPTAAQVTTAAPAPPQQPQQQLSNGGVGGTTRKWEDFNDMFSADHHKPSPPPPLPTTPMPQSPPAAALMQLPPPSGAGASRGKGHNQAQQPRSNVDIMHVLSNNGPDVGRRLENLRLTELEDIFDQEFDPRAGEPQPQPTGKEQRKNPFQEAAGGGNGNGNGNSSSANGGASAGKGDVADEPSSEDFERAISMIDSRLADMRDGFSNGLSFGKDDFQVADFDPVQAAAAGESNRKTT